MNLKLILMELGNRLVTDEHFIPAGTVVPYSTDFDYGVSTGPIRDFTVWLNERPEAREILKELGVEWPVINPPESGE